MNNNAPFPPKYEVTLQPIYPDMKNFCVIHILLFLLFMLVYQCASAQDYVLTNRGDSLAGEVKPLLYGPEKKVQITTSDRKKTTLTLFQVKSYSHDGEIFHPVKSESGYVFMKVLKAGYLSLYAFQQENQTRFDGLFLQKRDGSSLVVPNLGFKKYLSKFLDDCADVADRIKAGEFGKSELPAVVDNYNQCVNNRTVDHTKKIDDQNIRASKVGAWDTLEERVKSKEFPQKTDALEMISEIRRKIRQQEKIPNFMLEGLKNSLSETGLAEELDRAINELN